MNNFLGKLYVVAAPSGGGKTSLVNALVTRFDGLKISVSYTTRPARPVEIDGENYHFIDQQTFQTMIDHQDFLEHAKVYGYYYGTSAQWVLKQLAEGVDVVLEIDWQGARQVRKLFPSAISVFIIPPTRDVLLQRLRARQQDTIETITARMGEAVSEMEHCHEFDYLVINDCFDEVLEDMVHIVQAERLRFDRQRLANPELLADLLKNQ